VEDLERKKEININLAAKFIYNTCHPCFGCENMYNNHETKKHGWDKRREDSSHRIEQRSGLRSFGEYVCAWGLAGSGRSGMANEKLSLDVCVCVCVSCDIVEFDWWHVVAVV
jgi:hypothetical protein